MTAPPPRPPDTARAAHGSAAAAGLRRLFPGIAVVVLVAMSAVFVAEHYGGPVFLLALLIGMAVTFLSQEPRCGPGIEFCGRTVLRVGVALLGARITVDHVIDLGWGPVLVVAVAVVAVIGFGVLLARLFGLNPWFGVLTGGAVSICGASAAAAISAVLPPSSRTKTDTAFTVIGVTALSTLAMIAYPIVAAALSMDDRGAGFFFGATIHDVAQVVGAGFSVSVAAGDAAVVVKLFRVALLIPTVIAIALVARFSAGSDRSAKLETPYFLFGFVLLMVLGSTGAMPPSVGERLADASRWCLILAMAAIGMKTPLAEMRSLGLRPVAILVIETALIGLAGAVAALLLF